MKFTEIEFVIDCFLFRVRPSATVAAFGFIASFFVSHGVFAQSYPDCRGVPARSEACEIIHSRSVVDATNKPWSAIGRLKGVSASSSHCSGTLIGERTVLTAAHCLHNSSQHRWSKPASIEFEAGYHLGKSVARSTAVSYKVDLSLEFSPNAYIQDKAKDWAIVTLKEPIGHEAGYLKLAPDFYKSANLVGLQSGKIYIAGYIRSSPEALLIDTDCRVEEVSFQNSGYAIFKGCPMLSGDSGGPLLLNDGMKLTVLGVNTAVFKNRGTSYGLATLLGNSF